MKNTVSNIICSEFENNVGRWQIKKETMYAMKLTFRLSNNWDMEEGYRHLQMLIFGPMNYIGVFVKEDWTVIPVDELDDEEDCLKEGCDYRTGDTDWKMISYHDSCWTSDGVDRILSLHSARLNGLDFGPHWYEKIEVSGEFLKQLEEMMSREGDYRYEYMKGVLQFKMGPMGKIVEESSLEAVKN